MDSAPCPDFPAPTSISILGELNLNLNLNRLANGT